MDTYLYPIEDVGLGLVVLALGLVVRLARGRREAALRRVMLQRVAVRRRSATGEDAR